MTGSLPVPTAAQGNDSQDTSAQAPVGATCNGATLIFDRNLGRTIAASWTASQLPAPALLMNHFLDGGGTAIGFPNGSPVADALLTNGDFTTLNRDVQAEIRRQVRGGASAVHLASPTLRRLTLTSPSALYLGFRGTQGLAVSGAGRLVNGRWTGSLTYVIKDSYGWPARDVFLGVGTRLRYLQTTCGAPQHPGGAHWFPDSITVTVPVSLSPGL